MDDREENSNNTNNFSNGDYLNDGKPASTFASTFSTTNVNATNFIDCEDEEGKLYNLKFTIDDAGNCRSTTPSHKILELNRDKTNHSAVSPTI